MAQTKPLTGFVLDSLNRPIAYANVVAINQSTQRIGGFGISNDEGRFKITLAPGAEYLLRVSFVGFRQFEMPVKDWDSEVSFQIKLQQSDTELGLVEVGEVLFGVHVGCRPGVGNGRGGGHVFSW